MPAKLGLLKMTLEHHKRGVPRPMTLVPVYFGYEKLIEGDSFISELGGAVKQKESLGGLISSVKSL